MYAKLRAIQEIVREPGADQALAALNDVVPENTWVAQWQSSLGEGGEVNIQFVAFGPSGLDLTAALRDAQQFKNVKLVSIAPSGDANGVLRIEISADWAPLVLKSKEGR